MCRVLLKCASAALLLRQLGHGAAAECCLASSLAPVQAVVFLLARIVRSVKLLNTFSPRSFLLFQG